MSTLSIELFAYPWDIADRGPQRFADECRELGVNRVHVATLYHSGKFLLPHNESHKVFFPEPGRLFVPADRGLFRGPLQPESSALASTGWLEQLAEATTRTGIDLAAWTVFHHSSSLAGARPEFAIRNLFGDVYPFALCPSQAAVRAYSLQLASVIERAGVFRALDLETIGYLGYFHGHHHEVTAAPVGVLETFLLSLCFCEACRSAGEQAGIAVEPLRCSLCRLLETRLGNDDASAFHPANTEQLLTSIALSEPLQQLIRVRTGIVTDLVRNIRAQWTDADLAVFTSSFVGSPSNIWMEGVSMPDLRGVADVFQLLAYSSDPDTVKSDLLFCRTQIEDPAQMNLTLNLGLPVTPTLGHAMAIAEFAWRQGVRRFAFFNYGLLGPGRLRWIREIAQALRTAGEG
ncbi:MAG TPA: hypothetical protein VGF16_12725 [Bryobacteraceae bacterium]